MNKAKVYCVASAVAVCVASNPSVDVLAKHLQPVKLEEKSQQTISAEEFIKNYLSIKDNDTYKLITKVNETNYLNVLKGNQLFNNLTSENQNEIKAAYETAYVNAGMKKQDGCTLSAYEIVVDEANTIIANAKSALAVSVKEVKSLDAKNFTASSYESLKAWLDNADYLIASSETTLDQLSLQQADLENAKDALVDISDLKTLTDQARDYKKDDYSKESYSAYEDAYKKALSVLKNSSSTKDEVNQAQNALKKAIAGLIKKVDFSALKEKVEEGYDFLNTDKDMLTETSYNNLNKELDVCVAVLKNESSTQEDVNQALKQLDTYFNNKDNFEYKTATLELKDETKTIKENVTIDTPLKKEDVQEQPKVVTTPEVTKEVVTAPATTNQLTSTVVESFIKTYLTSSSGNVYAMANSYNYQKILSGMTSWMRLSAADRSAVNVELVSKGSKKYPELVKEAQTFSMNTKKSGLINTSTNTNATLYTWLCAMSLGMLTFVIKRLRKQD